VTDILRCVRVDTHERHEWDDSPYFLGHHLCEGVEQAELDYSTGGMIARFSRWIDGSYPPTMDAELVLRRRIDKLMEEVGEVGQALGGMVGENPRKGVTHTREQVMGELLDVAFTALGAWEHMDENRGRSAEALERKAVFVLGRVNLLSTEPQPRDIGSDA